MKIRTEGRDEAHNAPIHEPSLEFGFIDTSSRQGLVRFIARIEEGSRGANVSPKENVSSGL